MHYFTNQTHVQYDLAETKVRDKNSLESSRLVFLQIVLHCYDIFPVQNNYFKDGAHEDGKVGHTCRINLFLKNGQNFERDEGIADEHDCNDAKSLDAESFIPYTLLEDELPLVADSRRLKRLTEDVQRAQGPKVDNDISARFWIVSLDHSVIDAQ